MNTFSGIDISARSFDLVIKKENTIGKAQAFKQQPDDFERAAKLLKKKKVMLVVMEATGIYHLD